MSTETPQTYHGRCACHALNWRITVPPSEARTSLCHCTACKTFTGSEFGLTTKIPWDAFTYEEGSQSPVTHRTNHGVKREFCGTCGSGVREWGEAVEGKNTYVFHGALEKRGRVELKPKAEFYLKEREEWMRDIDGEGVFRKWEIKE
jgi:hypothetical protein